MVYTIIFDWFINGEQLALPWLGSIVEACGRL